MAKNKKTSKSKMNVTSVTNKQKQQGGLHSENKEIKETDTSLKMDVEETNNETGKHVTSEDDNKTPLKWQENKNFSESKSYREQESFERSDKKFKHTNAFKPNWSSNSNKSDSFFNTRRSEPSSSEHRYSGKDSNMRYSSHENQTERKGQYNSYTRKSEPYASKSNDDRKARETRHSSYEYSTGMRGHNYRSSDSKFRRDQGRRGNREDSEFYKYEREFREIRDREINFVKAIEIECDLFSMPEEYSLAHCVAEDMNMGSGIAVQFRYKFKKVDDLLNQRQATGGLALLRDNDRYIYYLVTKRFSSGKPTYATLFASLQKLKQHVTENGVKKLAMPRIGCGLDRLQWENVKYMIEFIFKDIDVEITICNLQQTEDSPQLRHKNCRVTNVSYPIHQIEEGTIIVYLSTEDGAVSEEMDLLNEKFNFLTAFHHDKKSLGSVIYFERNENYLLSGCIVKKNETDSVDFNLFQKCVFDIQKMNKKYKFGYIGFQAIKEDGDTCVTHKIINILRNAMRDVDVYICWPGELQNDLLMKERYDSTPRPSMEKHTSENWRGNSTFKSEMPQPSSGRDEGENAARDEVNTSQWAKETNEENWDENYSTNVRKSESNPLNASNTENAMQISEPPQDWFEDPGNGSIVQARIFPDLRGSTYDSQSDNWDDDHKDNEIHTSMEVESEKNISKNESESLCQHYDKRPDQLNDDQNTMKHDTAIPLNDDYAKYKAEMQRSGEIKFSVVTEKVDSSQRCSRAYYVTEDMTVESGIWKGSNFYNYLGHLLKQDQKEGGLASVSDGSDYVYCLVIKQLPQSTPTLRNVFSSIQKMRDHAMRYRLKRIMVPKMVNSDQDTIDWSQVKCMFEFLFKNRNTEIVLTSFEQAQSKNKLTHVKNGLHQMKKKSIIVYLASEDGHSSEEMKSLNKKFEFEEDFKKNKKRMGEVIRFKQNEEHVLYGCFVRKIYSDRIDFVALQQCMTNINENNTEKLALLGIQAVKDDDETVNFKIINILMHTLQDVHINMCWPGDLRSKMPSNKK